MGRMWNVRGTTDDSWKSAFLQEERDASFGCTGVVGCVGVRDEHNQEFS